MRGMRYSFPIPCTTRQSYPFARMGNRVVQWCPRLPGLSSDQHRVVHLYASVHDYGEAVLLGVSRGLRVDHTRLHPQDLRPGGDGILRGRHHLLAPAEDVYDVYGFRYLPDGGVRFLAQDRPGEVRVYREDPVPGPLDGARDGVARAEGAV